MTVQEILNAIKVFIVGFVYYIIPAIVAWLLHALLGYGILSLILLPIIALVLTILGITSYAGFKNIVLTPITNVKNFVDFEIESGVLVSCKSKNEEIL